MHVIKIHNEKELEGLFSQELKNVEIHLDNQDYFLSSTLVLRGDNVSIKGNGARLYGATKIQGGFVPSEKDNVYKRELDVEPFGRLFSAEGELITASYPFDASEFIYGEWDMERKALKLDKKYLPFLERHARISWYIDWVQGIDRNYTYTVEQDHVFISFSRIVMERLDGMLSGAPEKRAVLSFSTDKECLLRHNDWMFEENEKCLYIKYDQGDVNEQAFMVPVLQNILIIENASHVKVEQLTCSITNWSHPFMDCYAGIQSTLHCISAKDGAYRAPAMVMVKKSKNICFNHCELLYSGMTALDVSPYSHDVVFENGRIFSSGGNGLAIGYFRENENGEARPTYIPSDQDELVSGVYIRNNEICQAGRFIKEGSGILAGHCRDLYIEDNTISHTAYSGIGCGWGWTTNEPSFITNFQINRNKITTYLSSVLRDGAGIYLLGGQSGEIRSSVRENYVEGCNGYGVIYIDEAVSYVDVEKNALVGDGYFGLLYCHDIENKLKSLHLLDNYGTKNRWFIGLHTLPDGPTEEERDVVCNGLIEFDPSDVQDEELLRIIKNAGRK